MDKANHTRPVMEGFGPTDYGYSYRDTITPFYGQQVQGGVIRALAGIGQYDYPLSFADTVDKVRLFDAMGLHPEFVDVAGNNAISSFTQYQHPPASFFRPSTIPPRPRRAGNHGSLMGADEDYLRESMYPLMCTQDSQCRTGHCQSTGACSLAPGSSGQFGQFPGSAPRRLNQLLHGI